MPRDIAIIRAYQRPEFLYHTLECVKKAWKPEELHIHIWIDWHDDAPAKEDIFKIISDQYDLTSHFSCNAIGDSRSFLAALESCVCQGAERIYNIEEDVLIAPDFFRWHQAAHALGHYPLTVASNYHNDPRVASDADPTAVFDSPNSNPIGCCFSRWFAEMLVVHNTPDYWMTFQTMSDYLGRVFPEYPCTGNLQWDGLMHRLMYRYKLKCLYPLKPRAFHAGFYGANRGVKNPFEGMPLKDQIQKIGEIIFDDGKMQAISGMLPDCRAFSLEESQWTNLKILTS